MTPISAKSEWRWFARELRPFAKTQVLSIAAVAGCATLLGAADPLSSNGSSTSVCAAASGPHRRGRTHFLGSVCITCSSAGRRNLWDGPRRQTGDVAPENQNSPRHAVGRHGILDNHTVGDLVTRLEQEIDQLGEVAADLLPSLLRIILAIVVTTVAMLLLDWRLALLTVPLTLSWLPYATTTAHDWKPLPVPPGRPSATVVASCPSASPR